MALSIIRVGEGYNKYGLYDSGSQTFLIQGTMDEVFAFKHDVEQRQQAQDNARYAASLRVKWVSLLMQAGNTYEQADQFLKKQMPFLYEDQTT